MSDTLICFFDKYNGASIYAAINLKPARMVFVDINDQGFIENYDNLKVYLTSRLPNLTVEKVILKDINYLELKSVLSSYPKDKTIMNLSAGHRLMIILAYKLSLEEGYRSIYTDMDEEYILELSPKLSEEPIEIQKEMNIADIIAGSGGKSIQDNTESFKDEKIRSMTRYITENYSMWRRLKKILRNNLYIEYSVSRPLRVVINTSLIRDFNPYEDFFYKGEGLGLYKLIKESNHYLIMEFENMRYKSFLFKAGTWLEVLVYDIVSSFKSMEEVKGGVVFLWDRDVEMIKNEADVLATSNSKLIYISCKDTANYDENTLNELEVYSSKIGGERVTKILVATGLPNKDTITLRSEEMSIKIVIFQGDLQAFKKQLLIAIENE